MTTPRPVRYRCSLRGDLVTEEGAAVVVQMIDVSEKGVFIERAEELDELQVGDHARLRLPLPGSAAWAADVVVTRLGTCLREIKHPNAQHVTVVRHGFGLEFLDIDDDNLEHLRDFLELLDRR